MPVVPNPIEPTSTSDIAGIAKLLMRDHPRFFEASVGGNGSGRTFKLPHLFIEEATFTVKDESDNDLEMDVDYALDGRNGYITFATPPGAGDQFWITGYYSLWFWGPDLERHVQHIVNQHAHGRPGFSLLTLSPVEAQVIAEGAIVEALWSLAIELSTDIDVNTPEGMGIPASQRYRQVMALLDYWQRRYREDSAMLNVGLYAIQMYDLRRVSYTTGRLVPLYVPQEIDDTSRPVRIKPPIQYQNQVEPVVDP